ncbi:MAG: hypothetical protein ACR2JB_13060 [Bryobacteraceae bacterium]
MKVLAARNKVPVQLRDASLGDYAQVAELESRHGLATKNREEWEHLWANNPVYRQYSNSWPIGWVLEDSNRKIVGYLGNIPFSYEFEGKELLAAITRAWVVDLAYRGYSMLLLDYFFSQENVDLYLTTTLNGNAFEGFKSFAPLPVPSGDWDRSSFWITNPAGFLESALTTKEIPFARLLSYPLSALSSMRDRFTHGGIANSRKRIDIQFCSAFDERFDSFWKELRKRRTRVLLGKRTREVLDWHFRYALLRNEAWIFYISEGSRLLAYSIFYRQDNTKYGLKRMRLGDFQTVADDELLLLPMLSCALERCRRAGIHMLEILGVSQERAQVLAKSGPHGRKLPSWSSFYKTNNPELTASLRDPKCWDLSCFDGDSSL